MRFKGNAGIKIKTVRIKKYILKKANTYIMTNVDVGWKCEKK